MPANLRIRPAEAGDVAAVLAIEREQFSDPWPARHFSAELALPFARFFVAEDDRGLAGFIIWWLLEGTAELHNLAVASSRQRLGVASRLLDFMLAEIAGRAREVFLDVRVSNAAAIRLYEKYSFSPVARRRGYYRRPEEDALVYRLDLGRD